MNCVDSLNVLTVGERNLNGCLRIINYIQLCSWLECNFDLPEKTFLYLNWNYHDIQLFSTTMYSTILSMITTSNESQILRKYYKMKTMVHWTRQIISCFKVCYHAHPFRPHIHLRWQIAGAMDIRCLTGIHKTSKIVTPNSIFLAFPNGFRKFRLFSYYWENIYIFTNLILVSCYTLQPQYHIKRKCSVCLIEPYLCNG